MADDKPIIKATTPNSNKYDTKIDVYTSDPKGPHESIHIAVDSDSKSAHIIDTTNGAYVLAYDSEKDVMDASASYVLDQL